jgi:hypothetical protein
MNKHPEMGRELLAHELVEKTVVVVGREDRPHAITCWVELVDIQMVLFRANEIQLTLITLRRPDGTLADDTGKRILVWEFLGTV